MALFASGFVGRPPGSLTVQVPYADVAAMNGDLGMVDTTRYWNYGRNDGLSPVPAQPMAFLPGPGTPSLLGNTDQIQLLGPQIQLLGPTPIQLLGAAGPGWTVQHPKSAIGVWSGVVAAGLAAGAAVAAKPGNRGRAALGGAVVGAGLGLATLIIYGLS